MTSARRTLPRWSDSMSDGCSVPSILRFLIPKETDAECAACVVHDEAYYYGGSRSHRLKADQALRSGLERAGMPAWKAWMYYRGVRFGGHPVFRVRGVSWAFGGEHFRYDPEPAVPQ